MTVNRRSLLKAAGLVAVLDVEAVAAESPAGDDPSDRAAVERDDGRADRAAASPASPFATLPPLEDIEGGVMASLARGPALDGRAEMPLLPGADAVGSVLGTDAAVTVGYGGDGREGVVERLRDEGYREGEAVAGRQSFVARDRARTRLVVPGDDVTAVGRGPDYGAVSTMVERVLADDSGAIDPDLRKARGLLGGGAAVVVEVPADGGTDDGRPTGAAGGRPTGAAGGRLTDSGKGPGERRPVVSGERIAAADQGVSLRRVAVYPSKAASLAARESDWGPWPAEDVERMEVVRYGRAVVRDATAADASILR